MVGANRIVGVDTFVSGVMSRLTARSKWPSLGDALAAAERGDGSPLATLASNYQNAGATNAADARQSILCLDHPAPRELSAYPTLAEAAKAQAPVFGPVFTWAALSCGMWAVPSTLEPKPTRAAGAPPILVVGTTGDPATPQVWAEALAGQLERGVLLLRQGAEHVAYYYSACVRRLVDAYIVDGRPPASGIVRASLRLRIGPAPRPWTRPPTPTCSRRWTWASAACPTACSWAPCTRAWKIAASSERKSRGLRRLRRRLDTASDFDRARA